MSKQPLKVSLRIGGVRKQVEGNNSKIAQELTEDYLKEMLGKTASQVQLNLAKFAKNLPKVVENSYTDAVHYAATKMVGLPVKRGATERSTPQEIKDPDGDTFALWKVLSPRSIRDQNTINNARTSGHYFVRGGDLRRDLLGMARKYVKNTGVVKVEFHGKLRDARGRFTTAAAFNKEVSLGNFTIRLMPNIAPSMLPGLSAGVSRLHDADLAFEKKLGFSASAIKKLKGASNGSFVIPGTHRPLMQPVFTYWTLNRVPQVIARSIASAMPRAKRLGDDTGQTTFSQGTR